MLYTGSNDEELLFSGLDSGARGFALKDGSSSELVEALHVVARAAPTSTRGCGRRCLAPLHAAAADAVPARARDHGPPPQGLTGEQVAEHLFLSPETVKTHIRNAMAKLEASTRVHAVAIALEEGLISLRREHVRDGA